MKKLSTLLIILGSLLITTSVKAQNKTPDFWQCPSRQGGSWTIGRASSVCLVSPFQNPSEVKSYWSQVTYDDAKYNSSSSVKEQENDRYGSEMNKLISGFAESYYKKRTPSASSAEVQAWVKAILAVSHHESVWTHYRKGSDGQMRLLRGDFGHGHGLMQVDDRWHYAYVKGGGAARLQDNIIYGLDLFYSLWNKAAKASCVGSPTNYIARTKSTYSMYNGGEGSVCRWTNTKHKWHKNDKNFWDRFVLQGWKSNVISMKTFDYNFSCLVQDGGLKCFDSSSNPNPPVVVDPTPTPTPTFKLTLDDLYFVKSKNLNCTWNNQFMSCLPVEIGTQCLKDLFGISNLKTPIDLESKTKQALSFKMIDPAKKCISNEIASIGNFIETQVAINIRKTPGGDKFSTVPAKAVYQVLDVYINEMSDIVYYQVHTTKGTGYIFTSKKEEASKYTRVTSSRPSFKFIANQGDTLIVKNSSGINLRSTAGGTYILNIPAGQRLLVQERLIRSDDKYVYYKVEYNGKVGFIYSGRLAPSPNVSEWVEVK